ncbi:unnamed protein product [Brassica rapa]|uniref:tRNAHis guanylyltransferase catalytic domain-containing protein n=1 Tax=Brassica campestris TaxID=3711 RepID=A0A8D9HBP3_BRACM|nr:unnamed protein product [Brassica rapa]
MAKSKSKKKGKLNSQLYSPHIDIGDFVDGREDEQIRAPVWRGRCDGEQVRDPLCRGRRDGEQVRAPLWSGRDDELNFDIYMFKYQFLSSYQNVNRDGPYEKLVKASVLKLVIVMVLFTRLLEKPNDETALNLMNSCPVAVLEEYPNIIFAYG